jgi:hypothetical protein
MCSPAMVNACDHVPVSNTRASLPPLVASQVPVELNAMDGIPHASLCSSASSAPLAASQTSTTAPAMSMAAMSLPSGEIATV